MKVYIVTATDLVNRTWKTWIVGVFDDYKKAERYLVSNGCIGSVNPGGNMYWSDGIRTYDVCEQKLNEPSKEFRFCHAAGV